MHYRSCVLTKRPAHAIFPGAPSFGRLEIVFTRLESVPERRCRSHSTPPSKLHKRSTSLSGPLPTRAPERFLTRAIGGRTNSGERRLRREDARPGQRCC
jgi:hypothetical protein